MKYFSHPRHPQNFFKIFKCFFKPTTQLFLKLVTVKSVSDFFREGVASRNPLSVRVYANARFFFLFFCVPFLFSLF